MSEKDLQHFDSQPAKIKYIVDKLNPTYMSDESGARPVVIKFLQDNIQQILETLLSSGTSIGAELFLDKFAEEFKNRYRTHFSNESRPSVSDDRLDEVAKAIGGSIKIYDKQYSTGERHDHQLTGASKPETHSFIEEDVEVLKRQLRKEKEMAIEPYLNAEIQGIKNEISRICSDSQWKELYIGLEKIAELIPDSDFKAKDDLKNKLRQIAESRGTYNRSIAEIPFLDGSLKINTSGYIPKGNNEEYVCDVAFSYTRELFRRNITWDAGNIQFKKSVNMNALPEMSIQSEPNIETRSEPNLDFYDEK